MEGIKNQLKLNYNLVNLKGIDVNYDKNQLDLILIFFSL